MTSLLARDTTAGGPTVGAVTGTALHWLAPVLRMAATDCGHWPLPRVATRTAGTGAKAVRAGRDFAVTTMRRWGTAELSDDIAVVVSELLTNALRHTAPERADSAGTDAPLRTTPIRLGLMQPGRAVICAVADPSRRVPQPREPGLLAESGRGLQVIEALADRWGYTPPSHLGKVVWAMFRLPGIRAAR